MIAVNMAAADFRSEIEQAKAKFIAGKIPESVLQFDKALSLARADNDKIEVQAWQMKILNIKGHFTDSLDITPGFVAASLDRNQAGSQLLILEEAEANKGAGKLLPAETLYSLLLDATKTPATAADLKVEAALGLAQIQMWRGDWEQAQTSLRNAALPSVSAAEQSKVLLLQADFARLKGQTAGADTLYRRVISILAPLKRFLDPDLVQARLGLAEIDLAEGKGNEAQHLVDDDTRGLCELLDPSRVYLRFEDVRGRMLLSLGKSEEGVAQIRRAADGRAEVKDRLQSAFSFDSLGAVDLSGGNLTGAINNFQKAKETITDLLGKDSPLLTNTLLHLTQAYRLAKRPDEAIATIDQLARIDGKYLAKDSLAAADISFEEGSLAIQREDYQAAEPLLRQVHEVRAHWLKDSDVNRINADASWGITLTFLGRQAEAEPLLNKWEAAHAGDNASLLGPGVFDVKVAHATVLYSAKNYGAAIPLFEYAVKSRDLRAPARVGVLERLGDCYVQETNPAAAAKVFASALDLLPKSADETPRRNRLSFSLSKVALDTGDLTTAESSARGWMNDVTGHDYSGPQLDMIDRLAEALLAQQQFAAAQPYFLRILEVVGPAGSASVVARILAKLATVYEGQGKKIEAARFLEQEGEKLQESEPAKAATALSKSIKLRTEQDGAQANGLLPTLQLLAHLDAKLQNYAEARNLLDRAETIVRSQRNDDPVRLAVILNERGMISENEGKPLKAESLFKQAKERVENDAAAPRRLRASILCNLGEVVFEDNTRRNEAATYFASCLSLSEGASVAEPPPAEELEEIGRSYQRNQLYAEAEAQFKKASEIRARAYGAQSPQAAAGYFLLAQYYVSRSDFERAMGYVKQALAINQAHSVGEDMESTGCLSLLADIDEGLLRYDDAIKVRLPLVAAGETAKRPGIQRHLQLNKLAEDYFKVRDYTNALTTYQKVAQLWADSGLANPNYRSAEGHVVLALQETGKHEEAESLFQMVRSYLHANVQFRDEESELLSNYAAALKSSGVANQLKEANKLGSEARHLKQKHD